MSVRGADQALNASGSRFLASELQSTGMRNPAHKTFVIHAIILIAVSLPYCLNLGNSSIWDANEAFYAETPREMLVTGDYLAPQFNFEPRVQKPPLTYWAILISYKFLGVSEFAVRLPSAIAAIGTLLFSYGMARLLFSSRAALFAVVITATTARVFILARRLPIDILLLFFMAGTMFFLVRAVQKNARLSWALAYGFAALGFLTKGPVALIIPVCSYVLWRLWRRERLTGAHPLMGAAIFICIALPWYLYIYHAHGWTYISPFFLKDNLGRFAAESFGPSRGPLYYFSVYATDFFPWSLPALLAAFSLWLYRKKMQPLRSLSFGLPIVWCVLIFVLFSFSRNKQEYYIAPLYPAAAIVLAGVLDRNAAKSSRDERQMNPAGPGRPAGLILWTWMYRFLAVLLFLMSLLLPGILSSFMPDISPVLHYGPSGVFFTGGLLLAWSSMRGEHVRCFPALAAPLWMVFMICALFYLPALESFRPVKHFCRIIEDRSRPGDEAGFFITALPSMAYYLRRPIFQESNHGQMLRRFQSGKRVFCVLKREHFDYFAGREDVTIHILDKHARFSVRLSSLLNGGYSPAEELLLVSNQPCSETNPSGSRPAS